MIDVGALERDLATLTKAEREIVATSIERTVVDTAAALGWYWCHWRPAPRPSGRPGWAVPVQGTLGAGWPDLFLANPNLGRTLGLEVKAWKDYQRHGLSSRQLEVLDVLARAGVETDVITAADIRDPLDDSRLVAILLNDSARKLRRNA